MAEEDIIDQPSEAEKRIKKLSGDVRTMAGERDAEKLARETAENTAKEATRERDFYAGFADTVAANPAAKEHKDEILEKVKGGYSVEDATYAVLGKAGKLGGAPAVEDSSPAGGSATTTAAPAAKTVSEMSREDKRKQLLDAQQKGDLFLS